MFVDLQAVYPSPEEPGTELSFEEVWAANRGWLDQTWDDEPSTNLPEDDENKALCQAGAKLVVHHDVVTLDENGRIPEQHRDGRSKKKKVMEVNETQISESNVGLLVGCSLLTLNSQGKPGLADRQEDEEEARI